MWLFLIFLAVPLIEIALFIQVGGAIGLISTLVIVILTAILGTALVRQQGTKVLNELRQSLETLNDPARPLVHGALILFAGALLLTPGFFTDAVGLALLVPPLRDAIYDRVRNRVALRRHQHAPGAARSGATPEGVIDAEFHEVEAPRSGPGNPRSGWTRRP